MKASVRAAVQTALRRQWLPLSAAALMLVNVSSQGADLPIVCTAGACGGNLGPAPNVATISTNGNTLRIDQHTERALLNWASFNVSADGRVVFNQPSSSSIALNRIFDVNPSRILGAVEANGQIYLVNPNGFIFGRTARIDAAGILASTLGISDAVWNAGLLAPEWLQNRQPALASIDGQPVDVRLVIEEGARLSSPGGRVLLAAPNIDNAGTISTPDGQTILAAGQKVYLQASSDPALRGLFVEVDSGGEAWNRMTGSIEAARGNVTVAGLAVNQAGRISATTTVAANGSIRLLARETPDITFAASGAAVLGAGQNGGRLELASTSRIEVTPELSSTETAVDDQPQMRSSIDLSGREIFIRGNSEIVAPSAKLHVTAAANPSAGAAAYDPSAKLRVDAGALIDLSGSDVTLPMSRNQLTVELRANELRDNPAQRDGALQGRPVVVDARIGTPIADISGALASIPHDIAERTSQGGTSILESGGDIVVARGANIDVSGGIVTYTAGPIATSQLIGADGRLYDIGTADPNRKYVGVLNPTYRRADDRWGFIETSSLAVIGLTAPGYVEGRNAGTTQFLAPRMVLDGTLVATTTQGPYQRTPGQLPVGGTLIIGDPLAVEQSTPDYRAPSVNLSAALSNVVISDAGSLLSEQPLQLPTGYLDNGFQHTRVYSNGRITVADNAPLSLTAGSSLTLSGHAVDVRSSIVAPSGTIDVRSGLTAGALTNGAAGISVADDVRLDVSGTWTNDALTVLRDPLSQPTGAIRSNAGSISFATQALDATLTIGDGVRLTADAGAWLDKNGALHGGNGGNIALHARGPNNLLSIGESLALSAFGAEGGRGGSFALTAPRIELAPLDASLQATQASDEGAFRIGEQLFTDHGFRAISLTASGPATVEQAQVALRVTAGTVLEPVVSLLRIDERANLAASAASLTGLAQRTVPLAHERQSTEINLTVAPNTAMLPTDVGGLRVDAGASILSETGSRITLASVGSIEVAGHLAAPGGTIAMRVETPPLQLDNGYRAETQIHLDATAVLDVAGRSVFTPNDDGLRTGSVVDAGAVQLIAERGSVIVDAGSRIDLSGTQARFDVESESGYVARTIAANAGSLTISAPESIALNGDIRAAAGVGDTGAAHGGSLDLTLSRSSPFEFGESQWIGTYPNAPREIRVTNQPIIVGGPAPQSGLAVLDAGLIARSGIDALRLEADGAIDFDSVSIALGRSLVLDTPNVELRDGANVALSAAYVTLGNSEPGRTVEPVVLGAGTLNVDAGFLDAIGPVGISGTQATTLASRSDMRVRDAVVGTTSAGSLTVAGDLTLRASQLYPSTLANFTITATGRPDTTLRVEGNGTAAVTPLSAGGNLTLTARNIEQAGTIHAPFGQITLEALDQLTLADSSLTSVSGRGALIPFGRVENGEWIYESDTRAVQTAIPERRVSLSGVSIDQAASAVVDASGGGDLYAYEWIPGTGGSKDALAADAAAGRYAILPSLRNRLAPFDPQEFADSDLYAGASVYLAGGNGLEAGFYPLLPARYALMPGGLLIESVANSADLQPGAVASLADGTPVLAGYRSFAATGLGGTRFSGFAIRTSDQARRLALYQDHTASDFFSDRAARLDLPTPQSTLDAGAVSILATTALDMRGDVKLAGAEQGRNGRLEIAATRIAVVNQASGADDRVEIATNVLNRWQAGSLWIGGTERDGQVDVAAEHVTIASGASIVADEVVVTAQDTVTVEANAVIATRSSTRTTPLAEAPQLRELSLATADSGAALLALSDLNQFDVQRAAGGNAIGILDARAGSALRTRGALLIDAPSRVGLSGTIDATGAAWSLGSSSVSVGGDSGGAGLWLSQPLLAQLQEARSISLSSSSAIRFAQDVSLGKLERQNPREDDSPLVGTASITLRAAEIAGLGESDVALAAEHVSLQGGVGAVTPTMTAEATLRIRANEIDLGAGSLALTGFANTSLRAEHDVRAVGTTQVRVAGNLGIAAARIVAEGGGETRIDVNGGVAISRTNAATRDVAGLLGGSLAISADQIESAGSIFLPSGIVTLTAASALTLADGASIDTSGQAISAAGRTVYSDAGAVSLVSGGSLSVRGGSTIDVSAAHAQGGRLTVDARDAATLAGDLRGSGDVRGGSLDVHAGSLGDANGLIERLQSAGFSERQGLHVRNGDLALRADQVVTAREVAWSADAGTITIDGAINAASTELASSIRLNASGDITLGSTARLRTDAIDGARRGGDIQLGSTNGTLTVASGAAISANGAEHDGALRLNAGTTTDDVRIGSLSATFNDVSRIVVEPIFVRTVSDAPTAPELDAIRAEVATYASAAVPVIQSRLGQTSVPLHIEPGIELRHTGAALTLGALDLATWRFEGSPASLTVRSTGDVDVTGTISDGFGSAGAGTLVRPTLLAGDAANIRLVAGADLTSVDTRNVARGSMADLTLSPNAIVRSTTGDVELIAAGDLVFAGAGSSVYTAGIAAEPSETVTLPTGGSFNFADRGGDVSLLAGGNIVGMPVTQSVSQWQRRQGTGPGSLFENRTQWGVDLRAFRWNVGTFGGGELIVRAGQDVTSLSAATADSAVERTDNTLSRYGGGSMSIVAGGDVSSAMLYAARGSAQVRADGALSSSITDAITGDALGTLLQLGDAVATISARQDVLLESILNPTLIPQPDAFVRQRSNFSTYSERTAVDVTSVAGTIDTYAGVTSRLNAFLGTNTQGQISAQIGDLVKTLPPSLSLTSLSGDIVLNTSQLTLFPSDRGSLDLFAMNDIRGALGSALVMSDAPDSNLPTPLRPIAGDPAAALQRLATLTSARHAGDQRAVTVTAGHDIVDFTLNTPKRTGIAAGRDILNLSFVGQNLSRSDVTSIVAGRDVRYDLDQTVLELSLGGPGRFDIFAGRNVDLGFSQGITTFGRLRNTSLPPTDEGAALNVLVGMGRDLDASGFLTNIIAPSQALRERLVEFMAARASRELTFEEAARAFAELSVVEQQPLLLEAFFGELVAAGREYNRDRETKYQRGYDAIDALLPTSRDQDASEFDGDLTLAFSRIYTLAGGDINLVVPGGKVDVGLANPPPTINTRGPSQLGIVAQRQGDVNIFAHEDVLVNQSRVFTLLGGDIAIWSTKGDIDAGRGSKSSVSAPPPAVLVDPTGRVTLDFAGAVAGSGIRTIETDQSIDAGNVDLVAPEGSVNAGDAGIGSAGNLNIAAQQVVGLDNIQVGGVSTGVPPETSGIAASLSGATAAASSSNAASTASLEDEDDKESTQESLGQSALSWLDVFVVGLGKDQCDPKDIECLKRQPE